MSKGKNEPPRFNLQGERLTRAGTVDARHKGNARRTNGGMPFMYYEVSHKPNNVKPYEVFSYEVETGDKTLIGRFNTQKGAFVRAERLRLLQPDRRPTAKYAAKLDTLTRTRNRERKMQSEE